MAGGPQCRRSPRRAAGPWGKAEDLSLLWTTRLLLNTTEARVSPSGVLLGAALGFAVHELVQGELDGAPREGPKPVVDVGHLRSRQEMRQQIHSRHHVSSEHHDGVPSPALVCNRHMRGIWWRLALFPCAAQDHRGLETILTWRGVVWQWQWLGHLTVAVPLLILVLERLISEQRIPLIARGQGGAEGGRREACTRTLNCHSESLAPHRSQNFLSVSL